MNININLKFYGTFKSLFYIHICKKKAKGTVLNGQNIKRYCFKWAKYIKGTVLNGQKYITGNFKRCYSLGYKAAQNPLTYI